MPVPFGSAAIRRSGGDVTIVGYSQIVFKAMEAAKIDSPRGLWTMSKAHNPIQDIYLRKVVGKENKVIGVAHKALADPARGCKMG